MPQLLATERLHGLRWLRSALPLQLGPKLPGVDPGTASAVISVCDYAGLLLFPIIGTVAHALHSAFLIAFFLAFFLACLIVVGSFLFERPIQAGPNESKTRPDAREKKQARPMPAAVRPLRCHPVPFSEGSISDIQLALTSRQLLFLHLYERL